MVIERHSTGGQGGLDDARFLLYLPRLVAAWPGQSNVHEVDATLVFADVAGFTALTERLSAAGTVGSEQVTDQVNEVFTEILSVARLEGGDLLSFGGDAVLLMFSGADHRRRALSAAMEMQVAISEDTAMGASIGVASGLVRVVLAGSRQRVVLVLGSVVDDVVAVEGEADAGEVVASADTLDGVEPSCRGAARTFGHVVAVPPEASLVEIADEVTAGVQELARFVPASLHAELAVTGAEGEHRPAVIGFVKVRGTTSKWDEESTVDDLDRLIDCLVDEADQHRVGVLASDIDSDGLKLIVTAGVPQAVPEPHERLLRTLRLMLDRCGDLDVRVGVADGDVFAGDLGAAFRRAYTVMGDPVNTAARLAGVAGRGELLVSPRVAGAVAGHFDTSQRPAVVLKGKADAVAPVAIGEPIVRADGVLSMRSFVGREHELTLLDDVLAEVVGGAGTVLEVRGPGGIGKSRLVGEFGEGLGARAAVIVVAAQEYERSTPYRLVGRLLRRSVGIPLEASAEEAGIRLRDLVTANCPELLPWLPLLAVAAEAKANPTTEVHDLDPRFVSTTTARALVDLASALVEGPAVITIDDREWMDPASRELIEAMIELTTGCPWLWILTGRGESDWPGEQLIELGPLAPSDTRRLVAEVAPDAPDRVVEVLADRSDGNPLFAIELASLGVVDSVPDTIERLLATRIDQLGARERRLLRYASVLGNEFDLDLFAEAMSPIAGGLDDAGTWSGVAEFLTVSSLGKVRFVQGLVREVAYAGLSYRRRREIHMMVATTIERRARHRARRFAAVLALHFEAAGDKGKTWEYGVTAGERALATWANREAVAHFHRALAAVDAVEGVGAGSVVEAALAMASAADLAGEYGQVEFALDVADRYSAQQDRVRLAVARARLLEKLGQLDEAGRLMEEVAPGTDDRMGLDAIIMLAGVRYRQGRFADCASLAKSVVQATTIEDHPDVLAHGLLLLSVAQTHLRLAGRTGSARRAIEIFESIDQWSQAGKAYNNLAIDAYYRGDWNEAAALYEAGRQASERAGDVVMVATFDNNLGEIRSDQGAWDEARTLFDRARTTWTASGYVVGSALVLANLGRLDLRTGSLDSGIDRLRRALEGFATIGAAALAYETEIRLVEAMVSVGDVEEALRMIDDLDERSDERDGTLERLRGHAAAVGGRPDEATAAFERAIPMLEAAEHRYELGLALKARGLLSGVESTDGVAILDELGASAAHLLPLGPGSGR